VIQRRLSHIHLDVHVFNLLSKRMLLAPTEHLNHEPDGKIVAEKLGWRLE
jgi:hypothetical protein